MAYTMRSNSDQKVEYIAVTVNRCDEITPSTQIIVKQEKSELENRFNYIDNIFKENK